MTVEMVAITPTDAERMLSTGKYDRQRSVRAGWVSYLAGEMTNGSFKPNTMIEIAETTNGEQFVIDGQHRLSAVVASGKTIEFIVLKSEVKNEEEAARLYYRIDMNLGRGAADQLKALRIAETYGWTKRQLQKLSPAIALIGANFMKISQRYFHPDDRERLIHKYAAAADTYFDVIYGYPDEMKAQVERSSTVGVALVTFRYSRQVYGSEKVEEFWRGVIFDDGIKSGDPRKAANRFLLNSVIGGGGLDKRGNQRAVTSQESARYLANCFNGWVNNRTMTHSKVRNQYAPIVIMGSPFDGKQETPSRPH